MERKRRFFTLVAACLCVVLLVFSVSANSPGITPYITVKISHVPEGAVYADLLIPLKETDICYSALERENLPEGFPEDAEIIAYCQDGYRSYTFHYLGAASQMRIPVLGQADAEDVRFFETINVRSHHLGDIQDRGRIKIALLDAWGNILRVSEMQSPHPENYLAVSYSNYFYYDADKGTLELDTDTNSFGIVLYGIFSILGILWTIFLEWEVGALFRLEKANQKLVAPVNLASQLLMRGLFLLLYGPIFRYYAHATIFLEVLVYMGEFLFYRRKMREISIWRCLAFTVTANTVSLLLGFQLNQWLMPL